MKQTDWASRWQDGRTGFHQSDVSDFLGKYAETVWGQADLGRVLVPLCGKSLDMVFLAERAAEVVGVEFVEQAVREFFAERGLSPDVQTSPAIRYSAGKHVLYAADFFSVTPEMLGTVDTVFDRAALIALDPPTRIRYADHLRALLPKRAKALLISLDYDQAEMEGPPFAVSPEEVERLFSDGFRLKHLETRTALEDEFRARGVSAMRESAFALTRT